MVRGYLYIPLKSQGKKELCLIFWSVYIMYDIVQF